MKNVPMNLNSNTYVIAIDNTSKKATLTANDYDSPNILAYNGSDKAVFVFISSSSSDSAVFPTSATAPLAGKVIGPGAIMTFGKNPQQAYIYAIQASAGTGNLYLSVGPGE